MTRAEVIRKTKDVLFERGWHQGAFEGPDGSVCLEAALCRALKIPYNGANNDTYLEWAAVNSVIIKVLTTLYGEGIYGHYFNDKIAESFSDVVEVLDLAEKLAKEQEAEETA